METLDLLISFDDTGSMSSARKLVRQNVNNLVNSLFSAMPGLRVGVIIHNDYCDMPSHIFVLGFTTDQKQIERFVNQDSPCGGGDAPECYELALHEANKLDWISEKRAMLLIGDEVPHEVGYRYGLHTNRIDWKQEAAALASKDVKVYGIQALGRKSSNWFYQQVSTATGGVKLDLTQFQHVETYIHAVAHQQQGQLDAYQASNPSFSANQSLRNMFSKLRGIADTGFAEKIELMSKFQVLNVDSEMQIKEFVERAGATFRKGKGYYQLIGRTSDGHANDEIIQANKEVIFVDKESGETFSDTNWCREQLGIPYGTKGTCRPLRIPEVMGKYDVFIQSNSTTRKLDAGCKFLYELDHF